MNQLRDLFFGERLSWWFCNQYVRSGKGVGFWLTIEGPIELSSQTITINRSFVHLFSHYHRPVKGGGSVVYKLYRWGVKSFATFKTLIKGSFGQSLAFFKHTCSLHQTPRPFWGRGVWWKLVVYLLFFTASDARPLRRRFFSTAAPDFVPLRTKKPWVVMRFFWLGW